MAGLGRALTDSANQGASPTGAPDSKETAIPVRPARVVNAGAPNAADPPLEMKGRSGELLPKDDETDPDPNVSPEEQAAYDAFVENGMRLIYGPDDEKPRLSSEIVAGLKASDNPVLNLGSTVATLVRGLQDSAEQAGRRLEPEVMMQGGRELLEQLADVAADTDIHDFTPDELEQSFFTAIDLFRQQASAAGKLDDAALKQDFEAIRGADAEGRLGALLPGIDERMRGAG